MADQLTAWLKPIADWFAGFNTPEPIVHWGHPLMMGIVIFVLGVYVAWAGWRGRTAEEAPTRAKALADHKKLAPMMFLFIALGYTGGSAIAGDAGTPDSAKFSFLDWVGGDRHFGAEWRDFSFQVWRWQTGFQNGPCLHWQYCHGGVVCACCSRGAARSIDLATYQG